ncbi:MAG: hypothetical protein ACHQ4G_00705 [Opitutales bacterium]
MSTLPSDTPRLPKWPFLVADAGLLGVAALIAARTTAPYSHPVVFVIGGCVALAGVLGVVPFLAEYAGKQDEALDERQRGLEALTRTVAASAEQISIAANGLNELGVLAQKQVKLAEALPGRLQERIHEFNRQLNEATISENELLQQEVNTLRAAEAERLESAADRIHRSIAELTKLESSAGKQLAAVQDAVAKMPSVIATARDEALHALESTLAATRRKVTVATTPEPAAPVATPAPKPSPEPIVVPAAKEPPATAVSPPSPPEPANAPNPEPAKPAAGGAGPVPAGNPPDPVAEAPAAPKDESQVLKKPRPPKKPKTAEPDQLPLHAPGDLAAADGEADLSSEFSAEMPAESALTSDGATRLLVTAYIGIGNRLFLRGTGPGLSPDKGVPLQFVSIGKWRWETTDAQGSLQVRVFKNDEVACAALGEITLASGRQTEVTATF